MLVVFLLFTLWGMDVFVLRPRWDVCLKRRSRIIPQGLFLISFVMFLWVIFFSADFSFRIFSLVLFLLLGCYVAGRLTEETRLSSCIADPDQTTWEKYIFFIFNGILLKWFWGVLILSAVIQVVGQFLPGFLSEELAAAALLSVTSGLWMVFLALRFQKKVPRWTRQDFFGLSHGRLSGRMLWLWPIVTGFVIAVIASFLSVRYFSHSVSPFSEALDLAELSWAIVGFLGVAVLIVPFIEEVIFRGFFFHVLQECHGRWLAFGIVGTAFGVLHMDQYWGDWTGIVVVFILGFLLTAFRMVSGSVRPAIVLHYTFNMLMVIMPAVFLFTLRPVFFEYYVNGSDFSSMQKKYLLEESLHEDPNNALVYDELARLYLDQGWSLDSAMAYAQNAIRLIPDRKIFQLTQADIFLAMGRRDEAVAILEALYQMMPHNRELKGRWEKIQHEE